MNTKEEYPNVTTLTREEVEAYPFCDKDHKAAFYHFFVEKKLGIPWDSVDSVDCREIVVSGDIQDSWYRNCPCDVDRVALTMGLAIGGPKADYNLPEGTVCFKEGCVTCKE